MSEIPADLIATNSKCSPIFPKVMIEEMRMAMGIAKINRDALAYQRKEQMVKKSRPLPTKSSMYFQRLCIINTKNAMKNVMMNGPKKERNIKRSSFLIM
jgi:hypothetical protein